VPTRWLCPKKSNQQISNPIQPCQLRRSTSARKKDILFTCWSRSFQTSRCVVSLRSPLSKVVYGIFKAKDFSKRLPGQKHRFLQGLTQCQRHDWSNLKLYYKFNARKTDFWPWFLSCFETFNSSNKLPFCLHHKSLLRTADVFLTHRVTHTELKTKSS